MAHRAQLVVSTHVTATTGSAHTAVVDSDGISQSSPANTGRIVCPDIKDALDPASIEVPLVGPVNDDTAGWMGMAVYYIWPKKKKKKKTRVEKRRAEEEAFDNEPFKLESKDGDEDNDVNMSSVLQENKLSGTSPDDVVME